MSTKLWLFLALLGLLLTFFFCAWTHGRVPVTTTPTVTANTNTNVALAAPSLKVASENGKYRITGTVPDDATKQQILAKAKEVYGEGNYIDELKVGGVSKADWLSSALALMPFTKNGVTNGGLSVEGKSLNLIGEVPTQADKDKIYAEAMKANPNVTINNLLVVAGQKPMTEDQAKVQAKLNESLAGKIIEFETGSDKLTDKGKAILDEIAPIIKNSTDNLEVDGHTDNKGNPASNKSLSERRARTVVTYLTGKGIDAKRLTPKGFGQEKPVADNNTEEGRQRNRRIDFQVIGGGK
ncbi:MAG: OmpA family protein [Pyrinomonadaceae bacterium]|nr:OmpA family protein [Pyrinomonadaceae bacterium]